MIITHLNSVFNKKLLFARILRDDFSSERRKDALAEGVFSIGLN